MPHIQAYSARSVHFVHNEEEKKVLFFHILIQFQAELKILPHTSI